MTASGLVEALVARLSRVYGVPTRVVKPRLFAFGSSFACSISFSKRLGGARFFFGLSPTTVNGVWALPATEGGEYALLICGSVDEVLVLPRDFLQRVLIGVPTNRLDVYVEEGAYILQTTGHPKEDVSRYLNTYPPVASLMSTANPAPKASPVSAEEFESSPTFGIRAHTIMQGALIRLGRAEGLSVWVPPNDRALFQGDGSLAHQTLERLPSFGFDEGTRRIVQNIDVLWLRRNVIEKAFEVESTTSVYSGLLRLNDLTLAQPNTHIDLYIVAGSERRDKVRSELLRPSFGALLPKCSYLSFDKVEEGLRIVEALGDRSSARITGLVEGERFGADRI